LKPEWWGSLLVQEEKYQEKPVKREEIIIITVTTTVFQGDSLSPLLFCIALVPVTNELNKSKCGYQVYGTERKIIYMDYLKLIGRSEEELRNEIKIVKKHLAMT
jgi:hypothetical protein